MPLDAIESGILSNHIPIKIADYNNETSCGLKALTSTLICIRNDSELYTAKAKDLELMVENNSEYIKALFSDEYKNGFSMSLVSTAIYDYAMIYSYNISPDLFKTTEKNPMRQKLEQSLAKLHDDLKKHIENANRIRE